MFFKGMPVYMNANDHPTTVKILAEKSWSVLMYLVHLGLNKRFGYRTSFLDFLTPFTAHIKVHKCQNKPILFLRYDIIIIQYSTGSIVSKT